jgi:hypothetical protein
MDIEIETDRGLTSIKIDGKPEYAISGVDYCLRVDHRPTVTLHVLVDKITYVDREAEISLPKETVALLKKLGWKEPEK